MSALQRQRSLALVQRPGGTRDQADFHTGGR